MFVKALFAVVFLFVSLVRSPYAYSAPDVFACVVRFRAEIHEAETEPYRVVPGNPRVVLGSGPGWCPPHFSSEFSFFFPPEPLVVLTPHILPHPLVGCAAIFFSMAIFSRLDFGSGVYIDAVTALRLQ